MNVQIANHGYPNARTINAESVNLGVLMEFADLDSGVMRNALADLPALLASAPHRLMFFAGAAALIVSMLWWAAVLGSGYFGFAFPATPVPAGWAHAIFTQYGMLPPFMFGFLLTVFPRWMAQPALTRKHYVPVFVGVFGGYLLAHLGLLDMKPLLVAGLGLMLSGWIAALLALGGVLVAHKGRDIHAISCYCALLVGALGLAAFTAFVLGAPWQFAYVAIRIGPFGLLLPIFFTVCHRMVPFFSASAIGTDYRCVRPVWSLPAVWALLLLHVSFDVLHQQDLLWLADLPLAVVFLYHGLVWQPWKCTRPGLLLVLHLAFAWLPVAFMLYALQSLLAWLDYGVLLGRAPVHALTIGFFGSMLVAMVTRVTQGHSGRPLEMGAIPWLTFLLLQGVVIIRILAEFMHDASRWLVLAAIAWLVALLPWVVRSLWIFSTPRIDGKPG